MKATVGEIADAMPAMSILANREWPSAKGAYRVGKLVRRMSNENAAYERARAVAAQRLKNAAPADDAAASAAYNRELAELRAEEVDLAGCVPVPWADLEALKPSLAPAVLSDLERFIEAPQD